MTGIDSLDLICPKNGFGLLFPVLWVPLGWKPAVIGSDGSSRAARELIAGTCRRESRPVQAASLRQGRHSRRDKANYY
jgi:hypothetical protein